MSEPSGADRQQVARLEAQVAALRAELEMVERSAPTIRGDGKTVDRSWGASYPLARVRTLLADTAAAAKAHDARVRRNVVMRLADGLAAANEADGHPVAAATIRSALRVAGYEPVETADGIRAAIAQPSEKEKRS